MLEVKQSLFHNYVMATNSFIRDFKIKFRECDPAGISYFANIFSWAHDTFEEFLPVAGIPWEDWFHRKDLIVPIKHTECNFMKPFSPGESYKIHTTVKRLGDSSFTMKYVFKDQEGKSDHAEVLMTHVFLTAEKFKKTPIPENIRQRLNQFSELS